MRETSSQLQQMSIRQTQDMSGKLSNWSSLGEEFVIEGTCNTVPEK